MNQPISLDSVYAPSPDVVAREIEGDIIIVPLTAGIGDLEGELFSLNTTGKAVWQKLDGKKALRELIRDLTQEFEATAQEIQIDVVGLVSELLERKIVVETPPD